MPHRVSSVGDCAAVNVVGEGDKAEALRMYAKQAGESLENQNMIAEIKLRAERRAGELLGEMEKAKGGQPYQEKPSTGFSMKPVETLSDMGISKAQSSRWHDTARGGECCGDDTGRGTKIT